MSYSVKIEPSGHTFKVEENESILEAALRHGISLPYGCRSGACGSCVAKVVAGEIKYDGENHPPAVTDEEHSLGMTALCQAQAASDLVIESREATVEQDIQVRTLPCRIADMQRLNHDVMQLKLKLPSTDRLQFFAGQYIDLLLKDGRHRSFSLANPPHADELLELHIRHVEGGEFTSEVFDHMHVKDILRIEGPHGQFFLREDSDHPIIFMAGGTGFAPIKAMIEHALAADITRPMHLYWGARAKEDLYMHDYAQTLSAQHAHIRYTPVLSEPKAEDSWDGKIGYVHEAILSDHADLSAYEIYAAGPPSMVYAGRDHFPARGLDLENYISDAFEYNSTQALQAQG
jgi:CDP-4-dehydro-6-deoxyglucose reductase